MSYSRDGRLVWQERKRKGRRRQKAKIRIEERKKRGREGRKKESKLSSMMTEGERRGGELAENRRVAALFISTNFGMQKLRQENDLKRNAAICSPQNML